VSDSSLNVEILKFVTLGHYEPSFFPWHRQFIHIYEQTLRSKCGYTGSIPFGTYSNAFENFTDVDNRYWDWTLDWEDLTSSPIWDSELGFGGNGDIKHSDDSGGCLTNGPFTNLRPLFYNDSRRQHCLSRSFQEHDVRKIRPASVDAILNLNEFDGFSVLMEKEIHNIIPQTVRGDFLLLTAPNGMYSSNILRVIPNKIQILFSICTILKWIDCGGSGNSKIFRGA
jgi:tyrosinase